MFCDSRGFYRAQESGVDNGDIWGKFKMFQWSRKSNLQIGFESLNKIYFWLSHCKNKYEDEISLLPPNRGNVKNWEAGR